VSSLFPPAAPLGGMPAPAGVTAQSGPAGMPPGEVVDAMLKLAALYRAEESNHKDLLQMEKVTTLLQQILADRAQAAQRPIL
jgi:hypothetical protein